MFKKILDSKKEASYFITKVFKEKIAENQLEKYNRKFVTKIFENREADIIYKIKDKNVFILIEHQTKIDYLMPYRLLEYQMLIIESALDKSKMKNKNYEFPMVIPIILYTGSRKWNAKKNLEEMQTAFSKVKIKLSNYILVDTNDYTKEELLEDRSFLTKAMLIEKAKNKEELVEIIKQIIPTITEENRELFKGIVTIVLKRRLENSDTEELLKDLKGVDKNMLAVLDMIDRENRKYINIVRKEGKKEGKKEGIKSEKINIAKKLLLKNISINDIMEITGMTEKEIEKLRGSIVSK